MQPSDKNKSTTFRPLRLGGATFTITKMIPLRILAENNPLNGASKKSFFLRGVH